MWIDQLKVPVNFSEGAETWLKPSWLLLLASWPVATWWMCASSEEGSTCTCKQAPTKYHLPDVYQLNLEQTPLALCVKFFRKLESTIPPSVSDAQIFELVMFMSNLILLVLSQFLFNLAWDRCLAIYHMPTFKPCDIIVQFELDSMWQAHARSLSQLWKYSAKVDLIFIVFQQ